MSKKQLYTITGIIILLAVITMSLIFEIREIPDYSWLTQYDLEEKDPSDAYAFTELIKKRFGEDQVNLKQDSSSLDSINTGHLYVSIGANIRYNSTDAEELISFIEAGNDALIISGKINLNIPVKGFHDTENTDEWEMEVNNEEANANKEIQNEELNEDVIEKDSLENIDLENDDFYEEEELPETHDNWDLVDSIYYDDHKDSTISNYNLAWQTNSFLDSVLLFDFVPFDSTSSSYFVYKHYGREFKKALSHRFTHLNVNDVFNRESIIYAKDGIDIYSKINIGEGNLYVHTVPELFTNLATQQSFYLDHFNKVFSYFDTDVVILDKPDPLSYLFDQKDQKSPLQYILSVPSLSWAYYLLAATLLFFVIFRGKRTQRIIPTIQKNSNTSMDYIKTLSILHQDQGQNSKLVRHMRDGFYHRIKDKYYLDHKDEFFNKKLAAKSKIELLEIENLIHKLNSTEGTEFTDDQLITLFKQIESFYKKAA